MDRHHGIFNSHHQPSGHRRERSSGQKPTRPQAAKEQLQLGTRGLFMEPYSSHQYFSQRLRQTNPPITLTATTEGSRSREDGDKNIIVRFYSCEDLKLGRESLISPNIHQVDSAAVAFLGAVHLDSKPPMHTPSIPNLGWRGLDFVNSQGGFHLHYPDCAGARPFHGDTVEDWEAVMRVHARECPNKVLFAGVGGGKPTRRCR
jgi:hypothetical protein